MRTWDQLLAKLRGRHPRVQENEAMVELAEAYRDLCGEYRWKFLLGETIIRTEAPVSYGTVAVSNLGTALTLTPDSGGLTWSAAWINRRIVIDTRAEPYRVGSFGGATTATLLDAWAGDDQTAAAYTIYRSEYPMPVDCDYGRELTIWDVVNQKPLSLVTAVDVLEAESLEVARIDYPRGVARVQIQPDGITSDPLEMLRFFPAPADVYSFPAWYYRRPFAAGPTSGSAKPLWPAGYEDLIWRRAEINLAENPVHRIVISAEARQLYYARLWDLKKNNDGGAEIQRRIMRAQEYGWATWFRSVNFTSGGINPLVGG
jgi:hypothetical protein